MKHFLGWSYFRDEILKFDRMTDGMTEGATDIFGDVNSYIQSRAIEGGQFPIYEAK